MCARPTPSRVPRDGRSALVRRFSLRSKIRAVARWLALIAITQQISCSGGGGSSTTSNADRSPAITVSVSPSSSQISANATIQFIAIVQNASNPAVTWQVNGLAGGNSSVGTITPSGTGTATYMAPANVSAPLTVTVTAVLQADATQFGAATVTINPLPGTQISVSPANPNVVTGTSQQFTAIVQNGPQAVIWEVDGIQLGNSTVGFISSSGLYTAPATIPNPPMVTVTALLVTNTSVSGSTMPTVVAPPVSLTISPTTANVISGKTLQFSASTQNSNAALIWQVNGVQGGDQSVGMIAPSGPNTATYTAPTAIPPAPNPFTVTITAVLQTNPPISASAGVTIISASAFTGVFSWRNDNALTGQNPQETMLTPLNVGGGRFAKLFGCPVDGQVYAQPLYVANVTIPSQGTHNVVYVATENDSVYAFDADKSSCQLLWQVSFINPTAGITTVPATDPNLTGETDITPEIGITGTPVIDPNTATLYVVAKTEVIEMGSPVYMQKLHALDLTTGWVAGVVGAEKLGGPATIQASVKGGGQGSFQDEVSFDPLKENQRSALLLAGGNVYIAFDSYGDADPFHGWLFAYHAADLQAAPAVFNSTPNGSRGGIGESGAAPSSDTNGNIFVATSDGTFDGAASSDYAETLLKIHANTASSAFTIADTFTPSNEAILNLTRNYFGSTGVLVLPDSAGSVLHPNLAIAGGQAGTLYLLDRNNLGGFTPGGPDRVVQTVPLSSPIFGTAAYWTGNNTVYVAAAGDNLRAFALTSGTLGSSSCSPTTLCSSDTFPLFGASPVISSNGSVDGIVWAVDTSGSAIAAPAILRAYNATNLGNELYKSPASGTGAAGVAVKFAVPTVANGKVYIGTQVLSQGTTQGELSVFGLLP
jgi:hypothetical protein